MNEQTEFERRVSALLKESSESLDGRTRSRLTQARHAALESGAQASPSLQSRGAQAQRALWRGWAPAGALAMALMVTFFYARQPGSPQSLTTTASSTADDLDLLTDADAYELSADAEMELDADFYEWAAEKGIQSGAGQSGVGQTGVGRSGTGQSGTGWSDDAQSALQLRS